MTRARVFVCFEGVLATENIGRVDFPVFVYHTFGLQRANTRVPRGCAAYFGVAGTVVPSRVVRGEEEKNDIDSVYSLISKWDFVFGVWPQVLGQPYRAQLRQRCGTAWKVTSVKMVWLVL